MQYLWDLEQATVSDLLDQMGTPRPAHSTISSIIRILERKGYADHRAYGRTYVYTALVSKESYRKRKLNNLLGAYFDGSPGSLVNFLVREKDLDIKDLQDIMSRINKK